MHCNPDVRIVHRGKSKHLSAQERKLLERRQAIKPIIGHLKADRRMDRCYLKGQTGDRLHAVLCAAGYNIRWLQRMIAKKGIRALLALLLRLLRLAKAGAISLRPGMMHSQPAPDEYFRDDQLRARFIGLQL
jgi:IS5 family transposase